MPDSGVLGIIASVTAAEASSSVDGSGESGTTIAANVEHLRWSLAMMNAAIRGEPFEGKWKESWLLLAVDDASWDALQDKLCAESEILLQGLQAQTDLPEQYLTRTLALRSITGPGILERCLKLGLSLPQCTDKGNLQPQEVRCS